jgi:ferredoxin--NADP+ reductase
MSHRPLFVAVVGAGPAGIYAIEHLLEQHRSRRVEIDLYDRLATPWGLVRSGVAPDHPEKRQVIDRLFAYVLEDPRVRFFGNVDVGVDIDHDVLRSGYDAVVYASGATADSPLGLPGENLPGCLAARAFVGFYNGHPDYRDVDLDLATERAVVVGNGNVALDVARILVTPPEDLARTDIADAALRRLRESRLTEVVVMGRRGPLQAAFANAELEELERLRGVDVLVDGRDLPDDDEVRCAADPALRRKFLTLRRLSERTPTSENKRIILRFLESPVRMSGDGRVERIETMRNRLVRARATGREPKDRLFARRAVGDHEMLGAVPAGETYVLQTGLVLRATGYRSSPVRGLPFDDETGVIRNERGRVIDLEGSHCAGVYVTGWAKRGCRGIIGSNRKCAGETVALLLDDAVEGRLPDPEATRDAVIEQIEERVPTVSRSGWMAIDRAERAAGREQGRPRVKITERRVQLGLARPKSRGM